MSQAVVTNPGWSTDLAGSNFAPVLPQDEFLHPLKPGAGYASTETSYWGFCIPERRLMCEIYIWFHPALGTMSAGILLWTGIRRSSLAAEYVNHHHFLPMPADISHYRIEQIGLEIEVIEPLKRIRMRCRDEPRRFGFDVEFTGALPPIGRPNGHHLVQMMRTRGTLDLYGEHIPIDSHFTRDRSWMAERHETPMDLPPITWMTGNHDENFSFHLVAFDDPALDPDWKGRFDSPAAGQNLMWGYLQLDGRMAAITQARKRTRREADGVSPSGFELTIVDALGRELALDGEIIARVPWATWQNVVVHYGLTRWEHEGRVAWGDCQDIHYNRFVHEFSRDGA